VNEEVSRDMTGEADGKNFVSDKREVYIRCVRLPLASGEI